MKEDITSWKTYIEPYVGKTPILISPFGVTFNRYDQRFRYIMDSGYYIYCPVGAQMVTWYQDDYMLQSRLNMDGFTMFKYPERISKFFFDPKLVLDPARPALAD